MTVPTAQPYTTGYHKLSTSIAGKQMRDRAWMQQATCRGLPLDLFFQDRNSDNRAKDLTYAERKAKGYCARCPVRRECLEYGIEEDYGVWGGSLPSERKIGGTARGVAEGRKPRTDILTLLDELDAQAVKLGLIEKEVA